MRTLITLLLLTFCIALPAQKIREIEGSYKYRIDKRESREMAERHALHDARNAALEKAFGVYVAAQTTMETSTKVENESADTHSDLYEIAHNTVRGEWLETLEERVEMSADGTTIIAYVRGRAREIEDVAISLIAKVLRNGTEPKFESEQFTEGDDMYLYFRSPIDGYLTVYLHDEVAETVYCLLPYKGMGDGAATIEHDKSYVFFSAKKADETGIAPAIVDEYALSCTNNREYNTLYVIFSPREFAKANADDTEELLPRRLSFKAFSSWLLRHRTADRRMQLITRDILIAKPNHIDGIRTFD